MRDGRRSWLRMSNQWTSPDPRIPDSKTEVHLTVKSLQFHLKSKTVQTLGFRTEKLQNLIPTKLMEDYQGIKSQRGSYKVCPGLTLPSHKQGFKEQVWPVSLFKEKK